MDHIGIDLHKRESQICLLAEGGELIERRIRTEPQRFAEALGGRAPAQVLLESSTESEWDARCLEALGRPAWRRRRHWAAAPLTSQWAVIDPLSIRRSP